ncbi:MAG: ABC transporter ATP-binding protein [Eubacteriales bacterium]
MEAAIKAVKLNKYYGSLHAVKDLTLEIAHGEFFALLGVNGAGKTTTVKMLTGLSRPDSGDALISGHSIISETEEAKRRSNLSPQETAVAPALTVRENITFMAQIYGQSSEEAKANTDATIEAFSLGEVENRRASVLSGGWQRRLSIAMALVTRPEILILDEPTLGLDVIARRRLWERISALKGSVTVVLTTHYLEEAEALADRIGIISEGVLKDVGTAEELCRRAGHPSFEDAFIQLASGEVNG